MFDEIGVNESRILRWLIRNRQKKGIERRYKDEVKAIESEGGTPPPLDKGPDVIEEETPAELLPEPTPTPTPPPPGS